MKNINSFYVSGAIFWSKFEDKGSYSTLRIGMKLSDNQSVFLNVSNPLEQSVKMATTGNKIVILNGWLDLWEKDDGTNEVMLKTNGYGIQIYAKESDIGAINQVTVYGKILSVWGNYVTVEAYGARNPKTDQPTIRKVQVDLGQEYGEDVIGRLVYIEAALASEKVDEKKTKLVVNAKSVVFL